MRAKATNKLSALNSVVTLGISRPQLWIPRKVRYMVCCSVLTLATFPVRAPVESACPGIHVEILNIRNSTGMVACALFESPIGFPRDYFRSARNLMAMKIYDSKANCDFTNIPPGTYAIAVSHDENMNGKLDVNWLGVPTEGYGFSNNAKGILGPPLFSIASFNYVGQDLQMTLSLHY